MQQWGGSWGIVLALGGVGCAGKQGLLPMTTVPEGNPPALVCKEKRDDSAVEISPERAAVRRGQRDRRLSDRVTSLEEPIELCGFAQQYAWLDRVTCDDGSHPRDRARGSSAVNVDACFFMVDRWRLKCPEKTYYVAINQYLCTADEEVWANWPP